MSNVSQSAAQEVIRAWLLRVLAQKGWKPHRLAKEAKVSAATLSRALDAETQFVASTTTIEKIVRATGVAAPAELGMRANNLASGGFAEPEAIFIADPGDDLAPLGFTKNQAVWRLKARGIELAGYHAGDYLLVDPEVKARAQDVICVQIYDLRTGEAETVFRIYDPPYAVTETADPAARRKPVTIDSERAGIWGVVVKSLRLRRSD